MSCVVKSCRNHSGSIKKSQGITFHRFPSANDVWKNDWIKIIRECRNENNWNPSKSSVICSIHFEKNDLYTTKGGLLRVVAYAIPTKFLFDTSTIQEGQPAEVITFSVNNRSSSVVEGFSVQESTVQQSCLLNTNSSLQNESSETVISGVELEQPLSLLFTPRKRRMNKDLMKMRALMQNQKRKIKVLNQKVRRLQDRNKSLKSILKILNEENYLDSDLFIRLNEDIVAANIKLKSPFDAVLVQNQKKKIKVLNQKVRLLQDMNKSLKGIIKTLKEQNYVDSDLFNRLNEVIVAANIKLKSPHDAVLVILGDLDLGIFRT